MFAKYGHDFYNTTSSLSASFLVPNLPVRKRYSFSDSSVGVPRVRPPRRHSQNGCAIALAGRSVTSPWDSEWRYKSYLQVLVSYRFLTIRLLADYWWLYIPIIPDELTGDRRRASITASHCTEVPPSTNRRQIISGDSTSHSLLPLCNYIMLLAPTCIAHALYRPNLVSTVSTVYGTRCSSSTTIYSIVSIRLFAVLCNLVRNWIPINR